MSELVANLKQSWQESIAPLRQRWLLLAPREQQMLRVLGIFAAILLLVYGIWLPSRHAAENAQRQYESNRELLMQLQASGTAVHSASAMGGSLLGNVSTAAGGSGLTLARIEPEGDSQVRVWVEKADFNTVARWLATLSAQGLRLQEAQVEKQSEGSGVSARLVLVR
jgi:general secretion pathway protein M